MVKNRGKMKLCRFKDNTGATRPGLVTDDLQVIDLTPAGVSQMSALLEEESPLRRIQELTLQKLPRFKLPEVQLCSPVERQEVWAAGVTYLRSKKARMEESDFSRT